MNSATTRITQKITPFLWFDRSAEEAATFYTGIFPNSRIKSVLKYDEAGSKASGMPAGTAMTVAFDLDGQEFVALNGGPHFKINEAVSFVVNCTSQEEIDHYWNQLSTGGPAEAQQCGWLKDRYGVSWQVVSVEAIQLLLDGDRARAGRVMSAILQMKKIDIAAVRKAAAQ
jgi:predicted 3-demethylubiquinone-9 3-methyltransferase (glyoxalase superfamily)